MLWAGVDKLGRCFVFDESPRVTEGEWVSDDGQRGDGSRLYAGRGTNFYKAYIRAREREHGRAATRRKGDPRAFATQAAAAEGGKSLMELFADGPVKEEVLEVVDKPNRARLPFGVDRLVLTEEDAEDAPMWIEPAKVRARIVFEVEVLNNLLAYDEAKTISVENEPRLYISDRCQNLIRAMLNWDPAQGENSPWKDPIDTLRYLFDEDLQFIDPNVPAMIGGGGW